MVQVMRTTDHCVMLETSAILRALRDPRNAQGRSSKRWHEFYTLYWFSRFFSRKQGQEYLIGIRVSESTKGPIEGARLFDSTFGLDDDVDLVMGPRVLDARQPRENELRVQITRLVNCEGGTESLQRLLIQKMSKTSPDPTRILLVSLDESGTYSYSEINRFLRAQNCPFGQVFLIGSDDKPYKDTVFYVQVYPNLTGRWNQELAWP